MTKIVTPDCEGTSGSTMILRPLPSTSADSDLQNSSRDESICGLRLIDEHKRYKEMNKTKSDYLKGQLDPKLSATRDHVYYKNDSQSCNIIHVPIYVHKHFKY